MMLTDQLEQLHTLLEGHSLDSVKLCQDDKSIWLERNGKPLHLALPADGNRDLETPRRFLRRFIKKILGNARYASKFDSEG